MWNQDDIDAMNQALNRFVSDADDRVIDTSWDDVTQADVMAQLSPSEMLGVMATRSALSECVTAQTPAGTVYQFDGSSPFARLSAREIAAAISCGIL